MTGVVSYVFLSYSLRLGARSQKKWSICACPTFDTWPGEIKERRNWDLAWASKQCRHSDWNTKLMFYKKRRNAIRWLAEQTIKLYSYLHSWKIIWFALYHDRTENACTVSTSLCPIQSLRKLFDSNREGNMKFSNQERMREGNAYISFESTKNRHLAEQALASYHYDDSFLINYFFFYLTFN